MFGKSPVLETRTSQRDTYSISPPASNDVDTRRREIIHVDARKPKRRSAIEIRPIEKENVLKTKSYG